MTAPVTSYTTTDSVRSCLGTTDNEMSDEMLNDMGLSISVLSELESFNPTHLADWAASKGGAATADELAIGRNIQLFCNWAGAYYAVHAYLAIPQEISDGKASMARFATDTPERMLDLARKMKNKYQQALVTLSGDTSYSAASVMGKASPSFDPVTGTGS